MLCSKSHVEAGRIEEIGAPIKNRRSIFKIMKDDNPLDPNLILLCPLGFHLLLIHHRRFFSKGHNPINLQMTTWSCMYWIVCWVFRNVTSHFGTVDLFGIHFPGNRVEGSIGEAEGGVRVEGVFAMVNPLVVVVYAFTEGVTPKTWSLKEPNKSGGGHFPPTKARLG